MGHFKRTLKAYAGSFIAFAGAVATAALTGGEPAPEAVQAFNVALEEVIGAAVLAGLTWAGVYKSANKETA